MTDNPAPAYGPRISACPACDAAPLAAGMAQQAVGRDDLILSLPGVHCAACIADVEGALRKHPDVRAARVNLTLRRVTVDAPGLEAADLIPLIESVGYEAHELDPAALTATAADRQGRDILMRIGVSGFAMMNIMILSVAVWSGADANTRDMFHLISGAIAVPTVAFAGQPFFANAWRSLRVGRLGMDVPISLALILATAISLFETLQSGRHAYFDAAVMLCFFLLVGRYLDYRTRAVARSAAEELTALEVPRAIRLTDSGAEQTVSVADLRPGDLIRIRPGNRVAADGEVVEGWSEMDRSVLTGESQPVQAGPGMALSAGEVNLTGPLVLRVTAAGRDSSLAQLTALVAAAESARTKYTSLAERAARAYAPTVHLLALGSFIGWFALRHDWQYALNIAAAVLIITCPCALGLAVPAVVTAASGRLFRKGLLIKDGTALERLAEVDTVVFDKTGTLTLGVPQPLALDVLDAGQQSLALALAGLSDHPLSRGLAGALRQAGVAAGPLTDAREHPGHGIEGRWNGQVVRLGRADWVAPGQPVAGDGLTRSWLRIGQADPVAIAFEDRLRPGAADCVAALQAQGMQVMLLSGDRADVVAATAERLGIGDWLAGVTPIEKAAQVARLAGQGAHVLMVGDGLNDTAALAGAHVSISPATGLDAARVASDVVLMGQGLDPVADALATARRARRRIKENFAISLGYNVIAVPFAILGFATPLLAALAMSFSSITVTLNALRLK